MALEHPAWARSGRLPGDMRQNQDRRLAFELKSDDVGGCDPCRTLFNRPFAPSPRVRSS